ncbi:MAG: hypothetical protein J7M26_00955, partial [Armatimonadetes bacterium]|nr:hypothetical protein [Armatimonadota bacterium]
KYVVMVDLSGLAPQERARVAVRGELVSPGGKATWKGPVSPVVGHIARIEVPLHFEPAGPWTFKATAALDGRQVATASDSFDMPDMSWQGNTLYEKLELLPPWTPLAASGPRVSVWGREQTLSPFGYSAVTALGHSLLAQPCRLEAVIGGKAVTSQTGELRLLRHDEAQAVYEARAALGPLRWEARITAEFDGMVRVDARLVGDKPVKVQTLRLVLPFRASEATLVHFAGLKWSTSHAMAIPRGSGKVWQSDDFLPFVWVGNEDCGAMWFGESNRGWHNAADSSPMYMRADGRRVELVIEPVSEEVTLENPWRWTYGLMATPVKPLPENWRKYRWEPGVRANISIVWPHPKTQRYFGYPAPPADDTSFRKLVEQKHKAGIMVVPYSCLTFLSEQAPEWKLFNDRWWVTGVADRTASDVKQFGAAFMCVCPRAQGWSDFAVWANRRYMRIYQLDGLYHDCTFPYPCSNRSHGCGWLDEKGTPHKVYPVFAHRRLYRRVYAMMKSLGRPTYMVSHMSGRVLMPVLSFTDAYLDGEQFRSGGHHVTDYRDVLTLDYFRGEFMGKQWGLMPVFLPELAADARTRQPTRRLLAFALLHDTPVWAIWCDRQAVDELRRPLDAFDYVHADFVPYWHTPVETGDGEVKASAYVRDGRALLIVSNFAHADRTVTLKVRRSALKLPQGPLAARNAETGKALQAVGDTVKLTIPDGDLRLVLVTAGK